MAAVVRQPSGGGQCGGESEDKMWNTLARHLDEQKNTEGRWEEKRKVYCWEQQQRKLVFLFYLLPLGRTYKWSTLSSHKHKLFTFYKMARIQDLRSFRRNFDVLFLSTEICGPINFIFFSLIFFYFLVFFLLSWHIYT